VSPPESTREEPAGRRGADRDWMLPLLDILFQDYTETAAIRLLRDDVARQSVAPLLIEALAQHGVRGVDLESAGGDNLLQGLLALRAKFSWADAREKVIRNIAMSGGGR
jgi:hypothetical protein